MKKTTPSYGEDFVGRSSFEIKSSDVPIGEVAPGHDVMLKDIMDRVKTPRYDNLLEEKARLELMLKQLSVHPKDASCRYIEYVYSQKLNGYVENVVLLKREDVERYIREYVYFIDRAVEKYGPYPIIDRLKDIERIINDTDITVNGLRKYRIEIQKISEYIGQCNETRTFRYTRKGEKYFLTKFQAIKYAKSLLNYVDFRYAPNKRKR